VEGIFVASPDGRLLNVNPAFTRLLGYDLPAQILGTNIADHYPENTGVLLLEELYAKGITKDFEIVFTRRDGTRRVGVTYARADRDENGKFVRIQGLLNDITEQKEIEKEHRRAEEAHRRFVEAQLETLRYQINPHFLFNVLNSLDALSKTDPGRIAELIRQLSRYLRSTLSSRESGMVSLAREMSVIESYLNLEKVRFEDDLAISINVSEEIGDTLIPELLIQPIVENAVKHGMKTSSVPLGVDVACMAAGDFVRIEVSNTGQWVCGDAEGFRGTGGLGLENIRKRLDLTYGDRYRLNIGESEGRVIVAVEIPREGEKNEERF
jgi:PAS domain S-box-containing protein